MKTTPIGMSEGKGRNKGYRLNRTVRNKEYNFGSFQNYEQALRQNGYIDIIVADLKAAHEKEGVLSVEEVREMIVDCNLSNTENITKLVESLDALNNYRIGLIHSEISKLSVDKSFWQRIMGR